MKSGQEFKVEWWEDEDYIVSGYSANHPGTFTKAEAHAIVQFMQHITPIIQADAWNQGMTDAAAIVDGMRGSGESDLRCVRSNIEWKRDHPNEKDQL